MLTEALEPLPVSAFEGYASRSIDPEGKTRLAQFGYGHFVRAPSTFAPVADVPVGPDYVVGPGDEVTVAIWGKAEYNASGTVTRDGRLVLPTIGAVAVAAVPFGEVKDILRRRYDKHFVDYELSVSLGRLRTVTVHVVGSVRRPGTYELGATATVFAALSAAAGPLKSGTMRDVRLVRAGQIASRMDLYDLFLAGTAKGDVPLAGGDIVFVPRVGPLVAVGGAVKSPGIYELADSTAPLDDIVACAGGLAFEAAPSRVLIERVEQSEKIVLEGFDLSAGRADKATVQDGDIVRVEAVAPKLDQVVYLQGNVARPGRRAYRPGMRASELLEGEEMGSAKFWAGRKVGTPSGGVVPREEDATPKPYWEFALVRRIGLPAMEEVLVPFNLRKAVLERDSSADVALEPQDTVIIYAERDFRPARMVRSAGALAKPGAFPFVEGMTARDLVGLSGGLAEDAFLERAELSSMVIQVDRVETLRMEIDLRKLIGADPSEQDNPALRPDDFLFVRRVPEASSYSSMTLEGELRFPGVYVIRPGEKLSSALQRAGGFTELACLRGATFLRQSTKRQQQVQLDQAIADLEAENQVLTESIGHLAADPELAASASEASARRKATIQRLKQAKALGRIVIRMEPFKEFASSPDDLVLEDGDRLIVPTSPSTVSIMGSVYASTALVYRPGRAISEYLAECGGTTPNADVRNIFVLRTDGSVASRQQRGLGGFVWRSGNRSWTSRDLLSAEPEAGDMVVVPEKLEPRIYPLKFAKDMTQILYQIAVAAGIVLLP